MKMKSFFFCVTCFAALLLRASGDPSVSPDDAEWAAKRRAAIDRPRAVIYNTDGCDALYYPKNIPVSVEEFKKLRLVYSEGTEVDSIFYCPISSGFNHVTYRTKAGDRLVATFPDRDDAYNETGKLFELGTDPLKIAVEYAREHGKEIFVSLRFNDTHDVVHTEENPFPLFPQFKKEHPEVLFGSRDKRPPKCSWSAVDFTEPLVQERMLAMVRECCEWYDIDGVELDFMRHMQLLRSVAWGKVASREELDKITDLISRIRGVAEEVGHRRGRPILLAVRVPDSVEYAKAVGIDIEAWLSGGLADLLITTSYFQLNPWRYSSELAHKYGVKFYAALDESRIKANPLPGIPKRMSGESYAARGLAALREGADGIYYFNLEYGGLAGKGFGKWETLALKNKAYHATERGSGGYRPWHYLQDGDRYINLPRIEPGDVATLPADGEYLFEMVIGDDLGTPEAQACKPGVSAAVRADGVDADLLLEVNGALYRPVKKSGGFQSYDLPASAIVSGANSFRLTADWHGAKAKAIKLQDFGVGIRYRQTRDLAPALASLGTAELRPCCSIQVADGEVQCRGMDNKYSRKGATVAGDAILLDHADANGRFQVFPVNDKELLARPPRLLVAEWTAQAVADGPDGEQCFCVVLAPARPDGQKGTWEISLRLSTTTIEGTLGSFSLRDYDPCAENTYRIAVDTGTGEAGLWINGELCGAMKVKDGSQRPAPFIQCGDGSGSIEGSAKLKRFVLGTVAEE